LSRLISPDEFGIVSSLMIAINFINILNQIGVGAALIQKKELTKELIGFSFSFSLVFSSIMGVIYLIILPWYLEYLDLSKILNFAFLLVLYFPIKGFSLISESLLMREMRFKEVVLIDLWSFLFGYGIVAIVFGYLDFGYKSIIFGYFGQLIISTIWYWIKVKPEYSPIRINESTISLVRYGFWHSSGTIINYVAEQLDYLVTIKLYGTEQQGFYHKSFQLYSVSARLGGSILDRVFFPYFSKYQSDIEKIKNIYRKFSFASFFILITISIICYFFADTIVLMILGDKWSQSIAPFSILIWALYLRVQTKINKTVLKSLNYVKELSYHQLLFLGSLIFFLAIYGRNGISGVAWSVVFASLINTISTTYLVYKRLK